MLLTWKAIRLRVRGSRACAASLAAWTALQVSGWHASWGASGAGARMDTRQQHTPRKTQDGRSWRCCWLSSSSTSPMTRCAGTSSFLQGTEFAQTCKWPEGRQSCKFQSAESSSATIIMTWCTGTSSFPIPGIGFSSHLQRNGSVQG